MMFRATDTELRNILKHLRGSVPFAELNGLILRRYENAVNVAISSPDASAQTREYRCGEANVLRELTQAITAYMREPKE